MTFTDGTINQEAIQLSDVWGDWTQLQSLRFGGIWAKIRERRKMYKLDWTPDSNDMQTQKRWQDYLIDPLPRNDIDFKADRLTMRPLSIRIPTEQLTVDTVDILNMNNGFDGLNSNTDLLELSRKLKDTAKEMAQRRADSIEKFLNGTLYINMTLRKENLPLRWAMHMLVDGYAAYFSYYDATATKDEYPVILRAIDPLSVVYTRGDQKLDKMIIGRQATVFDLRREFGSSLFIGKSEQDIAFVLDYWKRTKRQKNGEWIPEVHHATYLGSTGNGGDYYLTGVHNNGVGYSSKSMNAMWALEPTITDYFEIPGDIIEARTTSLTEDPNEMVAGDLDAAKEIWEGRNYFLTRLNKLSKLGSGADLYVKGISGDVLQHIGKGEGATVSLASDSNINPADAQAWSKPPPADPNMQMVDLALNQMLQQSLVPITSLGNRGGSVSGAQVDALDQGAAVRLQTFINSMNMLHTAWCRTVMQIAQVFYADGQNKIPVYGMDKNSNPFATQISAADINGDFTVFAECNTKTNMELLQEALTALRLTNADSSQAIISHQTLRENYLNVGYNWEEEQRIKRESLEFSENQIKMASQQAMLQAHLQILGNLENMRVSSILRGVPMNPVILTLMEQMKQTMLQGMIPLDQDANQAASPQGMSQLGIMNPSTNEGAASAPSITGNVDQRTHEPSNPQQQSQQMQSNASRNGLAMPNGSFG
jgi:hypothetical protein